MDEDCATDSERSTLLRSGHPAKTSVLQDDEQDSPESAADCFTKPSVSFATYGQLSLFTKMSWGC